MTNQAQAYHSINIRLWRKHGINGLLSIKSTGACFVIEKTSFKRPIYVISGQFQPICPYIIIKGNKKFPNKKSLKVNCKEVSYPSTHILQEKEQNYKKCSPIRYVFHFQCRISSHWNEIQGNKFLHGKKIPSIT